ncbi:MAG TPA: hypothetical protein VMW16_16485 [Sedimentisphaerales bacterium]|nr:hypothetical protein [Sedimentisphaerales bacterium]
MAKSSKNIAILAGVASCVVFLASISTVSMAKPRFQENGGQQAAEQVKDPYEGARILLEAFVVEVELEALYKAGVSPIGQKPNSASIENILQCLKDKDRAKVTTGAKVAVTQRESGVIQVQEQVYMERQRPVRGARDGEAEVQKTFDCYNVNRQFDADVVVNPQGRIRVRFRFTQNTLGKASSEKDRPPDTIARNWSGTVSLEAGRPSIVGATQNQEAVVFLILCADIEKE